METLCLLYLSVKILYMDKEKQPWLIIAKIAIYLSLLTPLIVGKAFYFPFVGPKSLFFMACAEIAFFSWLILAIKNKNYRPKLNLISIAFILFLVVSIISSIAGVDFSRSFWSKFERMTGLLMWFHLFGYFLTISSIFKKKSDWNKFFTASVLVAVVISFLALLPFLNIHNVNISDRGGSTLGNTSFLGTYLLFNFFIALWLFFKNKDLKWKILYSLSAILMFLIMYLSQARAATISTIGGIFLIALLWVSFIPKGNIKKIGRLALALSILIAITGVIMFFIPDSPVSKVFSELGGKARILNREMAEKAFLEKPLLGWGLENYTLVFTKFFNPCLFLSKCGGEIWFDRVHNIVFDSLVTIGIVGLLSYLFLLASLVVVSIKKYFKSNSISFWSFAIFPTAIIAYFVQNLTVFDMVTSLMMFTIILGFSASGSNSQTNTISKKKTGLLTTVIILIFIISFSNFIIKPAKADSLVIKVLTAESLKEKTNYIKDTLNASPMGKYQLREFLAQNLQNEVKENINLLIKNREKREEIKKELDLVIESLEQSIKESPFDYRIALRLADINNIYYLIGGPEKLNLAEKYGKIAINISPKNQQGYWALAQTKAFKREFNESFSLLEKAIDLEPEMLLSYKIAFRIAKIVENKAEMQKIINKAKAINPNWEKEFNL